jgi:hypothetical protein
MTIKGSQRQEKIIRAWSEALAAQVGGLDPDSAETYVRQSILEAEKITEEKLDEMDKRELSDPSKAKFVGHVVSILYHMVAQYHENVNTETLRRILIDVYQQFPDHSEI